MHSELQAVNVVSCNTCCMLGNSSPLLGKGLQDYLQPLYSEVTAASSVTITCTGNIVMYGWIYSKRQDLLLHIASLAMTAHLYLLVFVQRVVCWFQVLAGPSICSKELVCTMWTVPFVIRWNVQPPVCKLRLTCIAKARWLISRLWCYCYLWPESLAGHVTAPYIPLLTWS